MNERSIVSASHRLSTDVEHSPRHDPARMPRRVFPGFGVPLGTPARWRELQQLPGVGAWYVLGLSAGLASASALAVLVAMSVIAWDRVGPFAGADYDAWMWLSLACYLIAAAWPALLAAASLGRLTRRAAQ